MKKQIEIKLIDFCKKFDLKPIYICHKTKLYEFFLPSKLHKALFLYERKNLELRIEDELKIIKLARSKDSIGDFLYGSIGEVVRGIETYDIEIAGNIKDLIENINIGSGAIQHFLNQIDNNERTEEVLTFARSKEYYIQPSLIKIEFDGIKTIEDWKAFEGEGQFMYALNADMEIESSRISSLDISINHKKKEGSLSIDFNIQTYNNHIFSDRGLRFEEINGKKYFCDTNEKWFSHPDYLKTCKIREKRKELEAIQSLDNCIDLVPIQEEVFTL